MTALDVSRRSVGTSVVAVLLPPSCLQNTLRAAAGRCRTRAVFRQSGPGYAALSDGNPSYLMSQYPDPPYTAIGFGVDKNGTNLPTILSFFSVPNAASIPTSMTASQAAALTTQLLTNVYLPDVMNALPNVALSWNLLGGLLDFDYNAGAAQFRASPMVKMISFPAQNTVQDFISKFENWDTAKGLGPRRSYEAHYSVYGTMP